MALKQIALQAGVGKTIEAMQYVNNPDSNQEEVKIIFHDKTFVQLVLPDKTSASNMMLDLDQMLQK